MNKLFLVGVLIMVACGGLFLAGFDDRKIESKGEDVGVFSVRTQNEADLILDNVPEGVEVFIINKDMSPLMAIEVGGNI